MTNYNEEKCFISNEQHYACNGVKQIMILTKSVFMDDEAGDKKLPDLLYGLSDQLWSDEQYQKTIDVSVWTCYVMYKILLISLSKNLVSLRL